MLVQLVMVAISAAVFYALIRFRIPVEVAIVVLAAGALDALVARRAAARADTTPAPTTLDQPASATDATV
jgi:hypothetical protein